MALIIIIAQLALVVVLTRENGRMIRKRDENDENEEERDNEGE